MKNVIETNDISSFDDFGKVNLDGKNCVTLRGFYEEIALKMHFPDYFAYNLDSLDEILCDLSWIEDQKLLVFISNSDEFLIGERNPQKVQSILDIFDSSAEELKWVDDEDKKEVIYCFSVSERIHNLLSEQ